MFVRLRTHTNVRFSHDPGTAIFVTNSVLAARCPAGDKMMEHHEP